MNGESESVASPLSLADTFPKPRGNDTKGDDKAAKPLQSAPSEYTALPLILPAAFSAARDQRAEYILGLLSPPVAFLASNPAPIAATIAIAAGSAEAAAVGSHGVLLAAAVFAAALTSSVAGFAFSAICGAMIFHLLQSQVRAVEIMMLCSIANQSLMNWSLRAKIELPALLPFLGGGLLGLPVGLFVLLEMDRKLYLVVVGSLISVYATYKLLRPTFAARLPHWGWDVAVGAAGGITGCAAALPGAPVTVLCAMKGWDKHRQRAVYQPFILLMQVLALAAVTATRHAAPHTGALAASDLLLVPAGLAGTWFGMRVFRKLNESQFANAANSLLLASGMGLLM